MKNHVNPLREQQRQQAKQRRSEQAVVAQFLRQQRTRGAAGKNADVNRRSNRRGS
jgi:hypothetical protein